MDDVHIKAATSLFRDGYSYDSARNSWTKSDHPSGPPPGGNGSGPNTPRPSDQHTGSAPGGLGVFDFKIPTIS